MDYVKTVRNAIGSTKIILNAAGGLIVKDGKILFQRRSDNGKWGLIGGILEMNETYREAALREMREETGLEVKLESFLGIFHNHDMIWANGDRAHVIGAYYSARINGGELRIDEESLELRFFGENELPELFAEDHRAAVKAYFDGVRMPIPNENSMRVTE
ncbi:MAG: NUDIX domain-containing protein [Clostridia bacterium]|nr:NUDIX domain-containing protein [Clostridia bacterium]